MMDYMIRRYISNKKWCERTMIGKHSQMENICLDKMALCLQWNHTCFSEQWRCKHCTIIYLRNFNNLNLNQFCSLEDVGVLDCSKCILKCFYCTMCIKLEGAVPIMGSAHNGYTLDGDRLDCHIPRLLNIFDGMNLKMPTIFNSFNNI